MWIFHHLQSGSVFRPILRTGPEEKEEAPSHLGNLAVDSGYVILGNMKRLFLILVLLGTAWAVNQTAKCPYDDTESAWTNNTKRVYSAKGSTEWCEYKHAASLGIQAHTFWAECE
jgi:hypothetical protein